MSRPDLPPPELGRRVERQAEDLRAVSDTVLEIKETVDGHTAELAEIKATVAGHTETLAEHGRMPGEILALLRDR